MVAKQENGIKIRDHWWIARQVSYNQNGDCIGFYKLGQESEKLSLLPPQLKYKNTWRDMQYKNKSKSNYLMLS